VVPDASPHLLRSAISAAFFFLPLGIVAVVFSFRCQSALESGNEPAAATASRRAKQFSLAAFIVGILTYLFLITAFLMLGAFTS
jgi:hypothetical protein